MRVIGVWLLYIVAVILVFIVLTLPQISKLKMGAAAFFALLIGAIAVFVASLTVSSDITQNEKNWLAVLQVIAYLLPIIALVYMIHKGEHKHFGKEEEEICSIHETVVCDSETGVCLPVKKKISCGSNVSRVRYT